MAAVGGTDPQRCIASNPKRPVTTPSLADSATKAIQLLEAKQKAAHSKQGFFLQIKGASTDKQDHAADPCSQIGEVAAFDQAVKAARAYAAKHPRHAGRTPAWTGSWWCGSTAGSPSSGSSSAWPGAAAARWRGRPPALALPTDFLYLLRSVAL